MHCAIFDLMVWSGRGPGNHGDGLRRERGSRGTRTRVGVCGYYRLQSPTVATVAGAGEVLDQMVARTQPSNFSLNFGVCTSERGGVLGRCFWCQGEVVWLFKLKWSSVPLFSYSNFGNYFRTTGWSFVDETS